MLRAFINYGLGGGGRQIRERSLIMACLGRSVGGELIFLGLLLLILTFTHYFHLFKITVLILGNASSDHEPLVVGGGGI